MIDRKQLVQDFRIGKKVHLQKRNAQGKRKDEQQFFPQNSKRIAFGQMKNKRDPTFRIVCYHVVICEIQR